AAGHADAKTNKETAKVVANMGYAPYPSVKPGQPSHVSIGGANLGIPKTGKNPELATQAALCMTQKKWQEHEAINEGLPPGTKPVYDNREVRKVYPSADLLRQQLKPSTARPFTPNYSDVPLAIQDTLPPPASINPQKAIDTLKSRLNTVS